MACDNCTLFVADTYNHRVDMLCLANKRPAVPTHRSPGPSRTGRSHHKPGEFYCPQGIACDSTALYVADTFNHRVQKLRLADCAHLGTVGNADCTKGGGEGQFADPAGMCVAGDTLYVCDSKNNRIVVLSIDLSWRYTIGRQGSGEGEFNGPFDVASRDNELYVTDTRNNRIQVFTPDRHGRMRFARAFGGFGDAPGKFFYLWGVAVVRGLLVVSEATRLQVLTPKGVPLQVLKFGYYSSLRGIGANNKHLWVADGGLYKIYAIALKPNLNKS